MNAAPRLTDRPIATRHATPDPTGTLLFSGLDTKTELLPLGPDILNVAKLPSLSITATEEEGVSILGEDGLDFERWELPPPQVIFCSQRIAVSHYSQNETA